MTPGIPGTGIGGLFYILCAMCMPFCELLRAAHGRTRTASWVVARQFAIGLAILVVVTVGLWLVLPDPAPAGGAGNGAAQVSRPGALRLFFLFGTIGTLVLVLSLVQLLRVLIDKPNKP
ncbi:MAG: hypothetical protein OEN20_05325 [Gammaproteobacteria bacterium]|nr:hypothetical protein [Gammaproteobacteria bacterium]